MSLDLISSLDTRFFADEISSSHIPFDLESSLGSEENMMSLSELTNDPMIPFHPTYHDSEFMDTGLSSDSDCNSYSGLLEFNLHASALEKDFSKFDSSDFPNLLSGVEEDIKLEPISPLAQSPQPLSPFENSVTSLMGVKSEIQSNLETPPISPPHLSNTSILSHHSNNSDIIKVITINADGNFHLPKETKVVLAKNNVTNVSSPSIHLSNQLGTNIQPKPLPVNPVVIKVVASGAANGKQNLSGQPLVLTPEEFATLTQQSSGKCAIEALPVQTQKLVQPINGRIPSPSVHYSKPILSCSSPPSGHCDGDVKALKRQQRMIKNRESACLSRKKKKEYVSSLESMLSDLNRENQQLKQENSMLRERVALLERERDSTNKSLGISPNTKKATTVLCAVLLMLSFNVATFGKSYMNPSGPGLVLPEGVMKAEPAVVFQRGAGRTLLWATEENPDFDTGSENMSLPMCPMLINSTESSRIDSELRDWFHAPSPSSVHIPIFNSAKSDVEVKHESPSKHELAKVIPHSNEMSSTAYRKYLLTQRNSVVRNTQAQFISKNEIQIYEAVPDRYLFAAFFEAIQRKDDTFYVVSFSDDHLLLPATEHNSTVRPRMSLLLPAMPLNQTMHAPRGHIAMMQIDCEVTNTRLLHIREDSIPPFMSEGNRTEDRRPETGKRAWRKSGKKSQPKVGNFNATSSRNSRG